MPPKLAHRKRKNGHQSACHFVVSSHRGDGSIAARDFLIQNMQLPHQRGERRAHAGRNSLPSARMTRVNSRAFLSPCAVVTV